MSTVSALTARSTVNTYRRRLEDVRDAIRRDMDHMNLENVNRRDEMDEYAEQIMRACANAIESLDRLEFQDH